VEWRKVDTMSIYPYEDEIMALVGKNLADSDELGLVKDIATLVYKAMQDSYTRGRNDEKAGKVGQIV
jgi:hypothetical protein